MLCHFKISCDKDVSFGPFVPNKWWDLRSFWAPGGAIWEFFGSARLSDYGIELDVLDVLGVRFVC